MLCTCKVEVIFQDRQDPVPPSTLCCDPLDVVNSFKYLRSLVHPGGMVREEVTSRIVEVKTAFVNLRHLWRCYDIRHSLKGRVYNATARTVFYGCETWTVRVADAQLISDFDDGYF